MCVPPATQPAIGIYLDGMSVPELTRSLVSMVIHGRVGRATAEIEIEAQTLDSGQLRLQPRTTMLAIQLFDAQAFTGQLTWMETRQSPAGSVPSLGLHAAGTAPGGSPTAAVSLRFDREIESGSVRRKAGSTTARCTTRVLGLRCGSRVELGTPDPQFDVALEVVEIWQRFDVAGGLRVEFVAKS